jgi:hypothetical protein
MHRRIAVPVRDVDLPVRRHRDVGRVIERRLERRAPAVAQHEQDAALGGELQHLVLVSVAEIDMVVRTDEDPVGVAQTLASPRAEEMTVTVEHQDRRVGPLVEVDAVLGIHRDVADEPEVPPGRERAPGTDDVVDEIAGPDDEPGPLVCRHPSPPGLRSAPDAVRV